MNCPLCASDGQGEPIPQEYIDKGYYAPNVTHYSRFIGVEYGYGHPQHYDGVSEWRCPTCGCRWGRFSGKILTGDQCELRKDVYAGRGL